MAELMAKGHNGTLVFDGVAVTIRRTGFLARASVGKGEKRIPLSSITAVQWKPPGALMNGFISFTLAGAVEKQSAFGAQTKDAVSDENSVVVTKKQGPEVDAFRHAVEQALANIAQPVPVEVPSGADEVGRLVALHAAGHLTDDEFAAAKKRALGI